jgi:integrase/recombinase XerD
MKINAENEKIKRRYLNRLRDAKEYSEATLASILRAICRYDAFSGGSNYRLFSPARAVAFKKSLMEECNSEQISLTTVYHILRHLRGFFLWLASEPGFRSRIKVDSVSYLSLGQNLNRQATSSKFTSYPTLEHVLQLVMSVDSTDEVAKRDQAIIAFLFLSGMRDLAIATLPIGCFDRETLLIDQDPAKGVHTKFRKTIITKIPCFDQHLLRIVIEWHEYLVSSRRFQQTDPFFPRTRLRQSEDGFSFAADGVEPVFWQTASPIRQILQHRSAAANLPYYKPHAFRHAAIHLAMHYCRTPEQFKAVSQNVGHANVGTTFMTYGNLDTHRAIEVVDEINFGPDAEGGDRNKRIDQAIEMLKDLKNVRAAED